MQTKQSTAEDVSQANWKAAAISDNQPTPSAIIDVMLCPGIQILSFLQTLRCLFKAWQESPWWVSGFLWLLIICDRENLPPSYQIKLSHLINNSLHTKLSHFLSLTDPKTKKQVFTKAIMASYWWSKFLLKLCFPFRGWPQWHRGLNYSMRKRQCNETLWWL